MPRPTYSAEGQYRDDNYLAKLIGDAIQRRHLEGSEGDENEPTRLARIY